MTNYIFLFVSVVCIGGQFSLIKKYQLSVGNNLTISLMFSILASAFATIIYFFLVGFKLEFSFFSLFMAAGAAISITAYTLLGLKAVSYGNLAVFTMFIMLGGMFLPFIYGITFLNEKISFYKIAGLIILIIALLSFLNNKIECKNKKLFFILCFLAFVLNGLTSCFNKAHQINGNAISTFSYSFLNNIVNVVVLLNVLLIKYFLYPEKKTNEIINYKKSFSNIYIIILFTLVSQVGNLLILVAAKKVAASVMFPIITGGSIITTAIFGRMFFKEKINKNNKTSMAICFLSILLFLF
jgi:drug/metabolite transporter (DMT)-like permease